MIRYCVDGVYRGLCFFAFQRMVFNVGLMV